MKMVAAIPDVALEELSGAELLDHAALLAATRNRCEIELLRAAVQHAYLSNPDTLDPVEAARPGRERARRLGGPGTPEVTEFAAAELGGQLGLSTVSAGLLMADGLDICHRLPQLWARVEAGQVRVHLARLVARKTRDLTLDQAGYVDGRVAGQADGRLTWTRFQALVDGAVAAADPETTAAQERAAAEQQVARRTHTDDAQADHGLRGFYIRAPFATVAVFDAALQRIADILADLGDPETLDRRRVKALLVLSRPDLAAQLIAGYQAWRDRPEDPADLPADVTSESVRTGPRPVVDWKSLLTQVVVHTHVYVGSDAGSGAQPPAGTEGIARVERCGAMSLAWVRTHLTDAAQVIIRPVLDLEGQAPVDSYEIPDRHRQAVRVMTPADTFPFSSSLHPDQIDHTEPFKPGPDGVGAGQSRIGNYGPMTTGHHRLKTHGRWRVRQPFPGIYLWRDPHGTIYLVDHTGTRALRTAA